MSNKTLTRADLTEAVYRNVGLSRNESSELVENILETIADRLEDGETVKLSSFGTFSVREKNERIGRNPKTGEEVPIKPRRVLSFRPSHVLKDHINKTMQSGESRNRAAE
ncbi:integration host factor subunit alpha [Parvularcula sp. IMCC14364]|uniref:integration host factor subunit alpha n=1 Tax=Parvularcula sp. IMCC14364 TaxID=3067902 RepID=UPI002741064F|nr:integration host factor subunit alpha [Parvularcula sp. IMCC14364]